MLTRLTTKHYTQVYFFSFQSRNSVFTRIMINFQIEDAILPSSQAIAEINRLMQDFIDANYVKQVMIKAIGVLEQGMNKRTELISRSQD
jgi:hypothetical protein